MKVSKRSIDKRVNKYRKGELNKTQVKALARDIIKNPVTKMIAVDGLIKQGKLSAALSII